MNLKKGSYYAAVHKNSRGLSFGCFRGFTPNGNAVWDGSRFSCDNGLLCDQYSERFGLILGRDVSEFEFCEVPQHIWNANERDVLEFIGNYWLK